MNQKGKQSLLKLYQTQGLYDTCRITGLKTYDIINILNQPLDTQLSNDLLFDMLKSGVLPKKYNDIEFFIGNDGVWYLDKKFDMGGDTYMKVYSMATPFWDGTDGLPFDTTNYTIFDKSNDKKISISDLTKTVIKSFDEDCNYLNCEAPTQQPKATEHIDLMIEMISELIKKGFAYEINKHVYFEVKKFGDYGQLSNKKL